MEQLAASGILDLDDRKNHAIALAQKMLDERGIELDLATIADAIEAAILGNGLSSRTSCAPSDQANIGFES